MGIAILAEGSPHPVEVSFIGAETVRQSLNLRAADSGANVILLAPFDPVVFDRTWTDRSTIFVAPSQAAVDLLTSPGRGPAEAEAVLERMASGRPK